MTVLGRYAALALGTRLHRAAVLISEAMGMYKVPVCLISLPSLVSHFNTSNQPQSPQLG